MLINNPTYTLRLIDLVDNYKYPFDFSEIYSKVGDMLEPIRESYYTTDKTEWNKFIKRFCRRFYNRNLNFDTFLDFTLKLQDVFDSKRMIADRYVILNAQKINPFTTYGMIKDSNGNTNDTVDTLSKSTSSSESTNSSENEIYDTSNLKSENNNTVKINETVSNLHSDTPATSVNLDNLFASNNYVTDANTSKNNGENTTKITDKTTNETDRLQYNEMTSSGKALSNSDVNTTKKSANVYKEIAEGYQGNPIELLASIDKLTTDIIGKYLLWIEEEHLFSSILY